MSTARSMRYVMHMADRYAKAKATGRKQADIDRLRDELKSALRPFVDVRKEGLDNGNQ